MNSRSFSRDSKTSKSSQAEKAAEAEKDIKLAETKRLVQDEKVETGQVRIMIDGY